MKIKEIIFLLVVCFVSYQFIAHADSAGFSVDANNVCHWKKIIIQRDIEGNLFNAYSNAPEDKKTMLMINDDITTDKNKLATDEARLSQCNAAIIGQ